MVCPSQFCLHSSGLGSDSFSWRVLDAHTCCVGGGHRSCCGVCFHADFLDARDGVFASQFSGRKADGYGGPVTGHGAGERQEQGPG